MRLPQRFTSLIAVAILADISLSAIATRADVVLPSVFSEHMVLQRSAATPIWGRADPGEKITLTLTPQLTRTTTADANGRWRIDLDLADISRIPSGPHSLTLRANNALTISDVLIGEVWLASGQSNMAFTMNRASGAASEIASSANTQIRFFTAVRKTSPTPLTDVAGKWVVASPDATSGFSAVAYYFARRLQAELGIPFGILHASWGGTPVEAWISRNALASNPTLAHQALKQIEDFTQFPATKTAWLAKLKPWLAANPREDLPPPPPLNSPPTPAPPPPPALTDGPPFASPANSPANASSGFAVTSPSRNPPLANPSPSTSTKSLASIPFTSTAKKLVGAPSPPTTVMGAPVSIPAANTAYPPRPSPLANTPSPFASTPRLENPPSMPDISPLVRNASSATGSSKPNTLFHHSPRLPVPPAPVRSWLHSVLGTFPPRFTTA